MLYLYTLDSHDCYGPFPDRSVANSFATQRHFTSYQILDKIPYPFTTIIHKPTIH